MYSRHARLLALVSGLAFAVAAPAPDNAPAWSSSQCTTPEITDASIDQTKRWNSVDTETAWKAALDDWKKKGSSGLTFTQEVSNFFNGPEQMLCGSLSARDGCGSYVQCNNVNHPAGMFILNSFTAISSLNYDIFDAISKAEGQITTDLGGFATTFAPIDDAPEALKLTLDLLGLGFALFASPVWNSALKAVPFFKANPNTLGTFKDWVNPVVSSSVTIVKDVTVPGAKLTVQNDLSTNLGNLVKTWDETVNTYNKHIFDGSDDSNKMLYNMITGGKVLEPGFTVNTGDVQLALEKTIYGFLIPQAWPLSNRKIRPVVIDARAPCGTQNPLSEWISDEDGGKNFVCFNGGLYYLMGATTTAGDSLNCGDGGEDMAVSCSSNTLPPLPGVDKLDGKAWGGVIRDDFVAGAVNSFNANGKKNGWGLIDATNDDQLNDIFDNGIRAAGVIQIPVCGADEAFNNWDRIGRISGGGLSDHFPCN